MRLVAAGDDPYYSAWEAIRAALAEARHPVARVTYFSRYGSGRYESLWLAPTRRAFVAASPLDRVLAERLGPGRAADLLSRWRGAVVSRQVAELMPRLDLTNPEHRADRPRAEAARALDPGAQPLAPVVRLGRGGQGRRGVLGAGAGVVQGPRGADPWQAAMSGPPAPSGDVARVSVFVGVAKEDAFAVFTEEIDRWWRTGPQYRIAGRRRGQIHLEPRLGGRLFETFDLPAGPRTIEVGVVTAWDPPARLALTWRGVNFKPGEATLVEVDFAAQGEGTLVTVCHRGWAALPPDHPARQGLHGAAFSRMIGLWWGGLMTSLREHVEARGPALSPRAPGASIKSAG